MQLGLRYILTVGCSCNELEKCDKNGEEEAAFARSKKCCRTS